MKLDKSFFKELGIIFAFLMFALGFYAVWWGFGKGTLWAKGFNIFGGIFYFGSIPWSQSIIELVSPLVDKSNSLLLRIISYSVGFTINCYILRLIYLRMKKRNSKGNDESTPF